MLKIVAFVLLVACTVGFCCGIIWAVKEVDEKLTNWNGKSEQPINIGSFFFDDLGAQDFRNSTWYSQEDGAIANALETVRGFQNKTKIQNGDYISDTDLEYAKQRLYEERQYQFYNKFTGYYDEYAVDTNAMWKYFEENYAEEIASLRDNMVREQLWQFDSAVKTLEQKPHIAYFVYDTDGKIIMRNKNISPEQLEEYGYVRQSSGSGGYIFDIPNSVIGEYSIQQDRLGWVYGMQKSYLDARNTEFQAAKKQAVDLVTFWALCLVLGLVCLIYLIYAAGKRTAGNVSRITMLFYDKLWNEFTVGFALLAVYCAGLGTIIAVRNTWALLWGIALLSVSVLAFYLLFFSLIRHLKNKTLIKNTLIYRILHWTVCALRKAFTKVNPFWRTTFLIVLFGLLTAIPFAFVLTIPLAVWFVYKQGKNFTKVQEGAAAVRRGRFHEKIELTPNSTFAPLAEDLNDIASGLQDEVERRVKSERLKTELIVNVSHDIKTPLTSLITYTDLLKKEHTDNENIKKYTEILEQKSARLKILIDDLFESAKAASGNIPVNFERVDVNALIKQGMGEMDDKIKASELDFKVNLPEEKLYAHADGQLLWRVFENLISNALKYSMPRSRVYIDVRKEGENVRIEFKNVSSAPLNIPEDEIMERFKRGDVSRNSDGSGLGLDIARSLMTCQNGTLAIKIDGDLFKAIILIAEV